MKPIYSHGGRKNPLGPPEKCLARAYVYPRACFFRAQGHAPLLRSLLHFFIDLLTFAGECGYN